MSTLTPVTPLERRKQIATLIAAGLICVAIGIIVNRFDTANHISDFYQYWYASDKWIETGRSVYSPLNAQEIVKTVANPPPVDQARFYYPAYLLILVGPLGLLPFPIASLIWLGVIQTFYLAAIWIACRYFKWPATGNAYGVLFLSSILFIPNLQHTIWQQFNTIGLFGLVLCWTALSRRQYALAGLAAISLTVKPQGALLGLGFLMIWAALKRERWPFLLAFGLGWAALWLIFELLLPGWLGDFLSGLQTYQAMGFDVKSVIDRIWNPYQIVSLLLVAGWLFLTVRARRASPDDAAFAGCLLLGFMLSGLVVPIIGMAFTVIFPVALIALASHLQRQDFAWYRAIIGVSVLVYVLGWVGLVGGLLAGGAPLHITLAELAYKIIGSIAGAVFACRVAWGLKPALAVEAA